MDRKKSKISLSREIFISLLIIVLLQALVPLVLLVVFYFGDASLESVVCSACGTLNESGVGNLYNFFALVVILCALICFAVAVVIARRLSEPIKSLIKAVRRGPEGLASYESRIYEFDELGVVIGTLSKAEGEALRRLNEEKERYRIIVEGSSDTFFTIDETAKTIEIMNSGTFDKTWDLDEFWEKVRKIGNEIHTNEGNLGEANAKGELYDEILIQPNEYDDPRWYEINGKRVTDPVGSKQRIVGYIRDINERKLEELKEERESKLDPATSIYRYAYGMEYLDEIRKNKPQGALILLDIKGFTRLVRKYGFPFGDVLLEELTKIVLEKGRKKYAGSFVVMRAGADELLMWISGFQEDDCTQFLKSLRKSFNNVIHSKAFDLDFRAGMCIAQENDFSAKLSQRVRVALECAMKTGKDDVFWNKDMMGVYEPRPFSKISSMGLVNQASMPSLAVNLLDRRSAFSAGMDLLLRRLGQKYHLKNVFITSFDPDYSAEYLYYIYQPVVGIEESAFVANYDAEEVDHLQYFAEQEQFVSSFDMPGKNSGYSKVLCPGRGIMFPMMEYGRYSGGIFFTGVDLNILRNKENTSELWEVGTIIQNRINQERLDLSAKAKSDFLARMSHEIRTPMNGVIGMTEIALQPNQTEQHRIECLEKVRSSSHYLLGLLNDILDMTKIEQGKMKLTKEAFDLNEVFDELHSVLDGRFLERKQRFVVNASYKHRYVVGDAMRLKQVLVNLLGNAIKYSDPETVITLFAEERSFTNDKVELYFAVQDQGIGISEDDIKRIFLKFEQVDPSNAKQRGTGLGLAISNYFVRLMDSTIQVKSTLGEGSTFFFTVHLPVTTESFAKPAESVESKTDFGGMQVLVAEDNELNQEILQCMLEELNCKVDCVADGKEALDTFSASPANHYQVILLDVMMPVMNGLDSARAIRALEREDAQNIPIIAVSANAFPEDVARSLASGMDAHLSKPVDVAKLSENLTRLSQKEANFDSN